MARCWLKHWCNGIGRVTWDSQIRWRLWVSHPREWRCVLIFSIWPPQMSWNGFTVFFSWDIYVVYLLVSNRRQDLVARVIYLSSCVLMMRRWFFEDEKSRDILNLMSIKWSYGGWTDWLNRSPCSGFGFKTAWDDGETATVPYVPGQVDGRRRRNREKLRRRASDG